MNQEKQSEIKEHPATARFRKEARSHLVKIALGTALLAGGVGVKVMDINYHRKSNPDYHNKDTSAAYTLFSSGVGSFIGFQMVFYRKSRELYKDWAKHNSEATQ